MLISRAHYPVLTLGLGTRAGIWTQGCSIGCAGCMSQDTWEPRATSDVPVSEILRWLSTHPDIDGITISGGEPLEQPIELFDLLQGIRSTFDKDVDILCYSGRSWRTVARRHAPVLRLLDAIVTGPFRQDLPTDHPLMGSANQELVVLSELGEARFGGLERGVRRPVQVSVDNGWLNLVGIPNPGDLESLESEANGRGVALLAPTWRTGP